MDEGVGGWRGVIPASTSPPRIIRTLSKLVSTTLQNWALFETISFDRDSMVSRGVSSQVAGRVERVSNL